MTCLKGTLDEANLQSFSMKFETDIIFSGQQIIKQGKARACFESLEINCKNSRYL